VSAPLLYKNIWKGRGSNPILITDNQSKNWLVYLAVVDGGNQIIARQMGTGETFYVSNAGIDCADISAAAYLDNLMVVWNQFTDKGYQIFERNFTDPSIQQITYGYSSAIYPALTVDTNNVPYLVYQTSNKQGYFNIYMQRKVKGEWTNPILISDTPGNNWCPSITVCSDDKLVVAWDGYASGSYDIYLRFIDHEMSLRPTMRLTSDNLFHAHASVSPAPDGGVWVAWNRGTHNWGKDNEVYRNTRIAERNYLHTRRFLEVRRVFPSRILPVYPPIEDFLDSTLPGLLYERPKVYSCSDGPLYLAFRFNEGELSGGHRNNKRWQAMLTCYDDKEWTDCIKLDGAYGLSTGTISILPGSQNTVLAAACGEGGNKNTIELKSQTYVYEFDPIKTKITVEDSPIEQPVFSLSNSFPIYPRHTIKHKGRKFHLYFGDLHRHTELSFCRTSVDGSLEEAYRYAKDAAAMDFVMTADHDYHQQSPDMWAETMKTADKFYIPGYFTTFFGYEWIGSKKNRRHRNIISTVRLPVPRFDYINGHRDVQNLWAQLSRGKAITIPHHTACPMSLLFGKDFGEASDPVFEPLIEIFQASRSSSEYPHCPTLCNSFYKNGEHRSFKIKGGFVSDALKQGIRMGFIASSDHMSTHRSYACLYAKENTREELIKSMIARRAYAATDRIICEFFIGNGMMGEEIKSDNSLDVRIHFVGTNVIKEITLLRDSIPFHTWDFSEKEAEIVTKLYGKEARGHYFYVRMIQCDSNLAWSSPIWVD